jgi:hypothetical protein
MSKHARLAFGLCMAALLSACGGGGSSAESGPSASPAAPVDNRVTLAQYTASRPSAGTPLPATAQQASDYRFATAPLADAASRGQLNTVLLPALHLNRRALLMSAAQGETLAELQAQRADSQGLAAGVLEREVLAALATLIRPAYLQDSERGSAHAQAPRSWRATAVSDWALVPLPERTASPTLVVRDSMRLERAWPGTVERFEGVFEADSGARSLQPMQRMRGALFQLDEATFTARSLQLGDGFELVGLVPKRGGLVGFVMNDLGDALVLLNQRLRAGLTRGEGALVLAQGGVELLGADASQALSLAGDPLKAQLTALDGRPQLATATVQPGGLNWDANGLRLWGGHTLAFQPLFGPQSNFFSGGSVFRNITRDWPVACRAGAADLRPMVLLLLDAQHRLVALASVAEQGGSGTPCQP